MNGVLDEPTRVATRDARAVTEIGLPRVLARIDALAQARAISGGGVCRLALTGEDGQRAAVLPALLPELAE